MPASSTSTVPSISYIQGHQLLGAEVNGDLQFWLTDALGTVRDVVDDSGNVIRAQEFDELGNLISSTGSGTFAPKTYQGALSDNDDRNDSGLYLMGHRHFDSTIEPCGFNPDRDSEARPRACPPMERRRARGPEMLTDRYSSVGILSSQARAKSSMPRPKISRPSRWSAHSLAVQSVNPPSAIS